jgi:hypothetical protein
MITDELRAHQPPTKINQTDPAQLRRAVMELVSELSDALHRPVNTIHLLDGDGPAFVAAYGAEVGFDGWHSTPPPRVSAYTTAKTRRPKWRIRR